MAKVKVRLLKPLNGQQIGSEVEYDEQHLKRLVSLGAVELVKADASAGPKKKAEPKPLNKMEPAALNKAAGTGETDNA